MEINPDDIEVSTYYAPMHLRMGNAVAARATHIPTGYYVEWNGERSLHKNKEEAVNRLIRYLTNKEEQERKMEFKESDVIYVRTPAGSVEAIHTPTQLSAICSVHHNVEMNKVRALSVLKQKVERQYPNLIEKNTGKPHVHAEYIKGWADGREVEVEGAGGWVDIGSSPGWNPENKYRFKPEQAYPETTLDSDELSMIYYLKVGDTMVQSLRRVANEAIKRYLQGQENVKHFDSVQKTG